MSAAYGAGPAFGEYTGDDENQLQPEDTLIDRGVDDVLDEGFSPPERPYGRGSIGPVENMEQRLAEQEPDPASRIGDPLDVYERRRSDEAERESEFPRHDEVGRVRAGRLVAPDMGFGEDTEAELVAADFGISGGAASAEEAAVHIIIDDDIIDDEQH